MLYEVINITSGTLNAGTLYSQAIVDYDPTVAGKGDYKPTRIIVNNTSGQSANFGLWTASEYALWSANNTISTLFPVASASSVDFQKMLGEIKYITASGSAGHTGNLQFVFVRE